ncbi:MAG: response regulator [Alphaproteobacteria bacterium]|nr:response regulator [Alphaproteobacteria bacterium]
MAEESEKLKTRSDPAAERLKTGEDQAQQPGVPRILIVEDSFQFRHWLESGLSARGFRVTTAENSQEGLRKAMEASAGGFPFDALITDFSMGGPELNGDRLIRDLHQRGALPPTVLYTAEPGNAMAALEPLLGITRDEYTDTPPQAATAAAVLEGIGPIHLTRNRFEGIGNRLKVHLVPKTIGIPYDLEEIIRHLDEFGVRPPQPGTTVGKARKHGV